MDFYKRMNVVCNWIPKGCVASYGQIALLCGRPRNSRQVGYGLNRGLAGEVPAHRIVNSRGILSGASSFRTPDTQKNLLEAEGVQVQRLEEKYGVDLKRFGWKNSINEAEALYRIFQEMNV